MRLVKILNNAPVFCFTFSFYLLVLAVRFWVLFCLGGLAINSILCLINCNA